MRVLPGTYVPRAAVTDRRTRLAAACAWVPHACLWGRSALDAAAGGLGEFGRGEEIALAGRPRHAQPGITWYAADVPAGLTAAVGGLRFALPALAAAALAATDGGAAIDRVLLRDPVAGNDLTAIADWFEGRAGNRSRRTILAAVRQRPWSGLERELHRRLRQARIGGWRANVEVFTPSGSCVPDVVFEEAALVVEVDSWEYHAAAAAFELDRRRQNGLTLAGYRILRFTGAMILDDPAQVIGTIRQALRTAATR